MAQPVSEMFIVAFLASFVTPRGQCIRYSTMDGSAVPWYGTAWHMRKRFHSAIFVLIINKERIILNVMGGSEDPAIKQQR